jgi:hypothetical protein
MRFRRWPRVTAYQDTPRKRAALARSQRLKRETLPLFAELIAEQQPSPDDEMSRRADVWPRSQQADRDRRAREWRRARTQIATYGNNLRRVINDLWRECPYPVDPSYLLTVLHSIDTGRLDPGRPPWQYHKALTPRITPNPLSFEDASRPQTPTHMEPSHDARNRTHHQYLTCRPTRSPQGNPCHHMEAITTSPSDPTFQTASDKQHPLHIAAVPRPTTRSIHTKRIRRSNPLAAASSPTAGNHPQYRCGGCGIPHHHR